MQGTFLWSVPQNNGSGLFGGLFSSLSENTGDGVFAGIFQEVVQGLSERQSGLVMEAISERLPLNSPPLAFLQRVLSSGDGSGAEFLSSAESSQDTALTVQNTVADSTSSVQFNVTDRLNMLPESSKDSRQAVIAYLVQSLVSENAEEVPISLMIQPESKAMADFPSQVAKGPLRIEVSPEDTSGSSAIVDVNALLKSILVSSYSAVSEQVADEVPSEVGAKAIATGATLTLEDGKLVVRIDADQLRDLSQQFSSDKQQPVFDSASGFEIVMYLPLQQSVEPEVEAVSGESVDSPLPQVAAEKVMTAVEGDETISATETTSSVEVSKPVTDSRIASLANPKPNVELPTPVVASPDRVNDAPGPVIVTKTAFDTKVSNNAVQSSASVESTKAPTFVSLEQLGEWLSTGLDDSIPVRMVVQPETEQVLFVVQPNTSQSGQEFPVQEFYLGQLASSEDPKIVDGVLQGSQKSASGEKIAIVSNSGLTQTAEPVASDPAVVVRMATVQEPESGYRVWTVDNPNAGTMNQAETVSLTSPTVNQLKQVLDLVQSLSGKVESVSVENTRPVVEPVLLDVIEPVTASKSSSESVTAKVPVDSQAETSLPMRPVASTGNTMLVEEVVSSGKGVVVDPVATPTVDKTPTFLKPETVNEPMVVQKPSASVAVAKPVEISAISASQSSPLQEVSIHSVSQGMPGSNSDTLLTIESKPTVRIQSVPGDLVASKPVNQPQPVLDNGVLFEPIANVAGSSVRSASAAMQGSTGSVTIPHEVPVVESSPIQSPVQANEVPRSNSGIVQDVLPVLKEPVVPQQSEVVQQKSSPMMGNSVTNTSEVPTVSENVAANSSKVQTTQPQQQAETVAMRQDVRVSAKEVSGQKVAFETISSQPKPEATVTSASEQKPVVSAQSEVSSPLQSTPDQQQKVVSIGQKVASISSKPAGSVTNDSVEPRPEVQPVTSRPVSKKVETTLVSKEAPVEMSRSEAVRTVVATLRDSLKMKSNEFSVGSPMKSVAQAETVTKVEPVLQNQANQSVQADTKQSAQQRSSDLSSTTEVALASSSSSDDVETTSEQIPARSSVKQKVESPFGDVLHRQTTESVKHTEMANQDVKPVTSQLSQPTQSTATGAVREMSATQQPYALPAEESVMQQVVTQVKQQGAHSGEMQVQLVPERLGTVRMHVGVEDGIVRARIVTETNEARSLLERNLNELKVALGDQGFRVQEVKFVTAGGESSLSAFDGNGSSQRQNLSQSHQQPSYQGSSSGNQSGRTLGESEQPQPSLRHWESLSQPGQGRVDYRV